MKYSLADCSRKSEWITQSLILSVARTRGQHLRSRFTGAVVLLIILSHAVESRCQTTTDESMVGIHRFESRHLVLYSDLDDKSIAELPAIFDEAVPQWADFYGVDVEQLDDWQVVGCLMRDKRRFPTPWTVAGFRSRL